MGTRAGVPGTLRCVHGQDTLGTGKFNAGSNPAWTSIPSREEKIWDFRVEQELSEKATPQQPHLPSAEILPMAPLLDIEKVRKGHGCNCSKFPLANDVFVNLQSGEDSQVDGKIPLEKEHSLVGFLLL